MINKNVQENSSVFIYKILQLGDAYYKAIATDVFAERNTAVILFGYLMLSINAV